MYFELQLVSLPLLLNYHPSKKSLRGKVLVLLHSSIPVLLTPGPESCDRDFRWCVYPFGLLKTSVLGSWISHESGRNTESERCCGGSDFAVTLSRRAA